MTYFARLAHRALDPRPVAPPPATASFPGPDPAEVVEVVETPDRRAPIRRDGHGGDVVHPAGAAPPRAGADPAPTTGTDGAGGRRTSGSRRRPDRAPHGPGETIRVGEGTGAEGARVEADPGAAPRTEAPPVPGPSGAPGAPGTAPGTLAHAEALRRALAWVRAGEIAHRPVTREGAGGADPEGGPAAARVPAAGASGERAGPDVDPGGAAPAAPVRDPRAAPSAAQPAGAEPSAGAAAGGSPPEGDRVVIEAIEIHVEAPASAAPSAPPAPPRPAPVQVPVPPPAPAAAPSRMARHWLRR